MDDPYKLQRFLDGQSRCYDQVVAELQSGRKRSHWMWFIFPQIRGLGWSAAAHYYALADREEARAYLDHGILGPRLLTCTELVLAIQNRAVEAVFPYPDCLKFRSSMTLFAAISAVDSAFHRALQSYFAGVPDALTLARLEK